MPALNDLQYEAILPSTANILSGNQTGSTGVLITIPANRTWSGTVCVSGSLTAAAGQVATFAFVSIDLSSGVISPATGTILSVSLATPALTTSTASNAGASVQTLGPVPIVIVAGSTGAVVSLTRTAASNYAGSAIGALL